ncbi:hypothetical protein V8C86DRAFT_1123586 [Haematococcus lacustris]
MTVLGHRTAAGSVATARHPLTRQCSAQLSAKRRTRVCPRTLLNNLSPGRYDLWQLQALSGTAGQTQEKFGFLFELEGAVIDMHNDGHRTAFNTAFSKMGYDCINWTPGIYNDLLAGGDGSPETLILNYFRVQGWPTMLATSEQPAFVAKVHSEKQAALTRMLRSCSVPLRTGVKGVICEALASGSTVAWVSGTRCEAADLVVANARAQLPGDVAAQVRVFSSGIVPQRAPPPDLSPPSSSSPSPSPLPSPHREGEGEGEGGGESAMEVLRQRQGQAKQEQARQFVTEMGKEGAAGGGPFAVDPTLLAAGAPRMSPEWLAAVAATLGLPMSRCAMLASSSSVTEVAAAAGMLAVAVPRKLAERGMFSGAKAKFPGYESGEATFGRLKALLLQHATQPAAAQR